MFVLCPHCQFLVALDPATGEPPPRCPRCEGAVQAAVAPASVSAALPEDAIAALPAPDLRHVPPQAPSSLPDDATPLRDDIGSIDAVQDTDDVVAAMPTVGATVQTADAPIDAPTPEVVPALPVASRHKHVPSFVPGERTRPTGPAAYRRRWIHASLVGLGVLLLLQIALADRARLAADARWRPALLQACAVLGCELPPWRELDAITLLDRDVRPDPRHPGVLHATVSFRNDARWPQPWPMLLLTLSDADGRVTGARSFTPSEYLHAADPAATQNGLASGQSASVALDIIEPEPSTVAFTFDFR
jgi:hypothetical protein